ncbi:MAG: hypothetical protein QOF98_972 [Streptomyces sp.]|nr:hypothetical protein [Streptomyces sp.]
MSRGARLATHSAVSTSLALRSDHQLRDLVAAAVPLGSGIGGRSMLLEVDGTPVFVKRIPLTDLERRPEHIRSTANIFGLPVFCHYGIGVPGFGTWRELAVHTMTTNWVLADGYQGFPLMYHWRVLPDEVQPLPEELADVERTVAYLGGGAGVRHRIEGLQQATASIALFLEYIPRNVHQWLGEQLTAGDEAADRACALVESELAAGTAYMNARGLLHFDVHLENILTDGRRLYFADYGLAISSRFDLSPADADFFDRHRSYDRDYSVSYFANWLVMTLYGVGGDERAARVRAFVRGERPTGIPAAAAAIITRDAHLADVMADFIDKLRRESRATPYPLEAIRRANATPNSPLS